MCTRCKIGRMWVLEDPLMEHQHWFMWWLGAVRQQAIIWTNVNPNPKSMSPYSITRSQRDKWEKRTLSFLWNSLITSWIWNGHQRKSVRLTFLLLLECYMGSYRDCPKGSAYLLNLLSKKMCQLTWGPSVTCLHIKINSRNFQMHFLEWKSIYLFRIWLKSVYISAAKHKAIT